MHKYLKILFISAALVTFFSAAFAEIYQWTDAAGVKHYTNSPPTGGVKVESTREEIAYSVEESEKPSEELDNSSSPEESFDDIEQLKQKHGERNAKEADLKTAEREMLEAQKAQEALEIIEQTSTKKGSRRRQIRRQKKQERLLRELDEKYADKLKDE
jgi:hypothetical protein